MKVFCDTCPLCCGDVGLTWEIGRGNVPVCVFCGTSLDGDASSVRRQLERAARPTGLALIGVGDSELSRRAG
ncbi:MAG: hypothetical protein HYY03_00870 [Chloroflexi bacterium]|nr:hypothetical protein [Chloroflexota bacterium]